MHHLRIGCGAVSTRRGKGARIGGVNAQRLRHQAPTQNLANSSSSRGRPARTPNRSTETRRIPALNPRQLGLRSARPRRAGSTRCSAASCWASGRCASRESNVIRSQSASSRSWPCWARSARRWCCARMGLAAMPMPPPPAHPLSATSTRPALRTGTSVLRHRKAWVRSAEGRALSLSPPFTVGLEHRGNAVTHYFDNLLSDSAEIRRRLRRRFHARVDDAFDLLTTIGRWLRRCGPAAAARCRSERLESCRCRAVDGCRRRKNPGIGDVGAATWPG